MKALLRQSWAVGVSAGLLVACSGGSGSNNDDGDDNGQAGSTTNPGGGATNPGSGGGTTNPSGGATTNPSGGSASVAGSASGGTSGVEYCIDFPYWDQHTTYPMNSKVYYNGAGYIAGNGGDPNAVNQSLDPVVSTWWWQPYPCEGPGPTNPGGGGSGGGTGNPPPTYNACPALDDLLGGAKFYEIFTLPCNNVIAYSYDSLCQAVEAFPSFANSGDVVADKRELAAFLAHAAKETWFLHYTTQTSCAGSTGTECGRGPIQITGWSNYSDAGAYLGLDLANNPTQVATDPVIGWKTALWYWNIHSNPGAGYPGVCHEAMTQNNFGQTTRIINGGIECAGDSASACKRAEIYTRFCQAMGNTLDQCTSGITLNCNGGACGAVNSDCG